MNLLLVLQLAFASSEMEFSSVEGDIGVGEEPFLPVPDPKEAHERTERLAKRLRCPVCQGLSVADSRSDAAVAMKKRIQTLVEQGYSEEQVEDYFIDRYGEWVLLKPKYEHWFVWVAPILVAVAGLGFVLVHTARRRETPDDASIEPGLNPSEEDRSEEDRSEEDRSEEDGSEEDAYRAKILAELDN